MGLIFLFSACGLPSSDDLDDLQPPLALTATTSCSGSTPIVTITFYGYNAESFFSGYNIYIAANPADESTAETVIKSYVSAHLVSSTGSESSFSSTVEQNYIVSSTSSTYPTLSINYLDTNFPTYDTEPTSISYEVNKLPPSDSNLLQGTNYGFGVTSVSLASKIETLSSNVVLVTTPSSCP